MSNSSRPTPNCPCENTVTFYPLNYRRPLSTDEHYSANILLVLEIQRFKSVKACRPKARQAKVNENSSTNSLNIKRFSVKMINDKTASLPATRSSSVCASITKPNYRPRAGLF
ncbi:MAG: hypothetical protein LBP59_13680 [Planctomycetaceae bacterium]|nr:hypothetical protein [Planctomycetaceae bacterium]